MSQGKLTLLFLAVIVVEALLPVSGPLTLGALYVLMARPPWFKRAMDRLYGA